MDFPPVSGRPSHTLLRSWADSSPDVSNPCFVISAQQEDVALLFLVRARFFIFISWQVNGFLYAPFNDISYWFAFKCYFLHGLYYVLYLPCFNVVSFSQAKSPPLFLFSRSIPFVFPVFPHRFPPPIFRAFMFLPVYPLCKSLIVYLFCVFLKSIFYLSEENITLFELIFRLELGCLKGDYTMLLTVRDQLVVSDNCFMGTVLRFFSIFFSCITYLFLSNFDYGILLITITVTFNTPDWRVTFLRMNQLPTTMIKASGCDEDNADKRILLQNNAMYPKRNPIFCICEITTASNNATQRLSTVLSKMYLHISGCGC